MSVILDELSSLTLTRKVENHRFDLSNSLDPPGLNSGVNCSESVIANLAISLMQEPSNFVSYLHFETIDLTSQFTISISGNGLSVTPAQSSNQLTIQEIVEEINLNAPISALVFAEAAGDKKIKLKAKVAGTHTTSIVADGSSTVSFTEDATECSMRVWGKTNFSPWVEINNSSFDLKQFGKMERIQINTLDKIYVQIYDISSPTLPANADIKIDIGLGIKE